MRLRGVAFAAIVGGVFARIWVLVCGSTNPMKGRIANASLTLHYEDGIDGILELIPPWNYWLLCLFGRTDYDYSLDSFALPKTPPQVRLGANCRAMVYGRKLRQGGATCERDARNAITGRCHRPDGHQYHEPEAIEMGIHVTKTEFNRDMKSAPHIHCLLLAVAMGIPTLIGMAAPQPTKLPAEVVVDADKVLFRLSDLMIGANMEDLHYQMVGGIDSQLIHGESFFEPSPTQLAPKCAIIAGFANCGGKVTLDHGELALGPGTRLTSTANAAEASVELSGTGAAGLALCVSPDNADNNWKWYSGYTAEIISKQVVLSRADRANKPREVARAQTNASGWVKLAMRVEANAVCVDVNGTEAIRYTDEQTLQPAFWAIVARDAARFRGVFELNPLLTTPGDAISLRWAKVQTGSATGGFSLDTDGSWCKDSPSQTITFNGGNGEWGIDNAGLKRWGIDLVAGKPYEGFIRVKATRPTDLWVSLRAEDGRVLAEENLVANGTYPKIRFSLTPSANAARGRFAITLKKPGSVTLGYVFLQPGEWGRYKGLPIRKDLAEALLAQGIRVLRFNGGMIEVPGYRWRNLRRPRDERAPYDGFYDRYCSSGFGPAEAVAFGKAAGITVIPGLNIEETPEEFADFAATCHPAYLQVANESAFNKEYVEKFKRVAEAVWKIAPDTRLVTTRTGSDGNALHLELTEFARAHGKPIMFDCHSVSGFGAVRGPVVLARWLQEHAPAPSLVSVGVFEFNDAAFDFQRGLNHALAMNDAHRNGDVIRGIGMPNASQPWGVYQTDWKAVLWTQGNISYTPSKVWLQPAALVDQMIARDWAPDVVACNVVAAPNTLDVFAARTSDGKNLVLRMVNPTGDAISVKLTVRGMRPTGEESTVETLSGDPAGFNTLEAPDRYKPRSERWPMNFKDGEAHFAVPPHTFAMLTIE